MEFKSGDYIVWDDATVSERETFIDGLAPWGNYTDQSLAEGDWVCLLDKRNGGLRYKVVSKTDERLSMYNNVLFELRYKNKPEQLIADMVKARVKELESTPEVVEPMKIPDIQFQNCFMDLRKLSDEKKSDLKGILPLRSTDTMDWSTGYIGFTTFRNIPAFSGIGGNLLEGKKELTYDMVMRMAYEEPTEFSILSIDIQKYINDDSVNHIYIRLKDLSGEQLQYIKDNVNTDCRWCPESPTEDIIMCCVADNSWIWWSNRENRLNPKTSIKVGFNDIVKNIA